MPQEGQRQNLPGLVVKLAPRAIEEYPLFYDRYIKGKLKEERVGNYDDICQFINSSRLTVTGELGDQLFGSNTMRRAVMDDAIHLDGPWTQPTFWEKPLSEARDSGVSVANLGKYLEPQLKKSPLEISTLFDLLWWINFSLKWQHVGLRLLHCRGNIHNHDVKRLVHFFESDGWQQWSFHNHALKLPNLEDWKSYKTPLKKYIYDFT